MRYSELQVTSNFTFLRGASHPDELVDQAAELGYEAIAITDWNTLAGIVRAHAAAKPAKKKEDDATKSVDIKSDIRFIPAARLNLLDGTSLLAYPTDKAAYQRLSALLTKGNLRAEKGECHLYKSDVYEHAEGLIFVAIPPPALNPKFELDETFVSDLKEYRRQFGSDLYVAASRMYNGDDDKRLYRLSKLGVPMVATNDVHYHIPERRELQDVLTCTREKCTIHNAGFRLHHNAERFLKPIDEMERLFKLYPEAIENANHIADRCRFSLDSLEYVYPEELTTEGRTPQEELVYQTWEGARKRYGDVIPPKIIKSLNKELAFMEKKNYASYFLTVFDLVRFAREQKILCQGRGSAANSVVCFCLGITSVDPTKFNLLFARFMSDHRDEPPDIDVDFEHERREEVMQYVFNKYGRDRAAIVATVTQERHKGAIRDVGKAMGLSVDTINRLAGCIWDFGEEAYDPQRIIDQGLNPEDPLLYKVLRLTSELIGFPRQLGQHTGGFVITQGKLSDLCPVMNARMEDRTCIEWNKDDIDQLKFMKVDVLALGMLTCIRKAFDLAEQHYDVKLNLADVAKKDDARVYEMICHADTIGVFQIESRAQMSMLPRLRPNKFYDLVIEVAIVRPGPIQGDMVHPYLRRRNGEEVIDYPPGLESILGRTLGVPLFQEQAMEIAIEAAGFTPSEADQLRRSMATFKAKGKVTAFEEKLVKGMTDRGYDETFARRVFRQLEGFGSYGFPESHAASFALLVYVSSWLKCYYPDVFATALLNSLPMGFYQPAQIIGDARNHGVEVRAADVNSSYWDYTLEEQSGNYKAIRIGFRQITGMREEDANLLVNARTAPYTTITQLMDAGLSQTALETLADADGFRSLGFDRRQALWEVSALHDRPLALFEGQPSESTKEGQVQLPLMTAAEHVTHDYATTTFSLKAHPVSFAREKLNLLHITPAKKLSDLKDGMQVKAAGLVLVRQRPATASGVVFITIEDETGAANLVVFNKVFDTYRKEIIQSKLIMVEGRLQIEGEVIHIVARRFYNLTKMLGNLRPSLSRADETTAPYYTPVVRHVKSNADKKIYPKGRNFH